MQRKAVFETYITGLGRISLVIVTVCLISTRASQFCKYKNLTEFALDHLKSCLQVYKAANGNDIDGDTHFPVLNVPDDRPENKKEHATCGIQFITAALNVILEDQMNYLNPGNKTLQETFNNTIGVMENLQLCMNKVLDHHCQHHTKPHLPNTVYKKKEWSVGVIKASEKFLKWILKDHLYIQTKKPQKVKML